MHHGNKDNNNSALDSTVKSGIMTQEAIDILHDPEIESGTDINDLHTAKYMVPLKYPLHSPVGEDKGVVLIPRTKEGGYGKGLFIPKELT